MPPAIIPATEYIPKSHIFRPFIHPDDPNFEYDMAADLYDIVSWRQIHSQLHKPTCFKYGSKKCRMRFPRKLIEYSTMDERTGVVYLQRDHKWLNGYNKWLSIMTRANLDCQFILTKAHALASIHYIIKYIIAAIKTLVQTSPEFHEINSYRWPFMGSHAKFTSKDDIGDEYKSIWDGRDVEDVNNPDNRHKISADMITEGSRVMLEYSVVPYLGQVRKEGESFLPGCTLKLLSIGLLKDSDGKCYNFESPRKKRRMREY